MGLREIVLDALDSLSDKLFPLFIYEKSDTLILILDSVEVETSDGKRITTVNSSGISEQMTYTIRGQGFSITNYQNRRGDAVVRYGERDVELFQLSLNSFERSAGVLQYQVDLEIDIQDIDPIYTDNFSISHRFYIASDFGDKKTKSDALTISASTQFYEGPIRQNVDVRFEFNLSYNLIRAFDRLEYLVYSFRSSILEAASRYQDVPASLVAAIIYDELFNRTPEDDWQEQVLDPNTSASRWKEFIVSNLITPSGTEDNATIGVGQLSVSGLQKLIDLGYINAEDISGWGNDSFQAGLQYLLDPDTAVIAVAANLQYLIDIINHDIQDPTINVAERLEIVAYYYSAGYIVGSGTIPANLANGFEKVETMPRLQEILSLP
jgi:hypothetical protein